MSQGIIQRGGVYRQRIATLGASMTGGMKRQGIRIPEFAVGLLIVASCVGGALMWQNSQDSGVSVLITSRFLTRGAQVRVGDLVTAHISSDTEIALLPSSAASQVIGMRASFDIPAGTPLNASQLISVAPLGKGEGLAGITVTSGQAPANLSAGDDVQLIAVDSQSDGSKLASTITGSVQVWEISEPDAMSGDRSVTLRVGLASASQMIGHDELHLIKVVN
ncbi:MAG: SAF domain-containing protein [Actinobacteria bacterium]|nr:SAF domain-containing protein [Actinomycetota bacterium]